jgi:hypothetical protein
MITVHIVRITALEIFSRRYRTILHDHVWKIPIKYL